MSKIKKESIATIFCEHANTDEYQEAYRLNGSELVSCSDQFWRHIEMIKPNTDSTEIADEAGRLMSAAEELGFILGFKYAFKLAAETFSK